MPSPELTVDEFLSRRKSELDEFASDYKSRDDAEAFPEKLDYADWLDILEASTPREPAPVARDESYPTDLELENREESRLSPERS